MLPPLEQTTLMLPRSLQTNRPCISLFTCQEASHVISSAPAGDGPSKISWPISLVSLWLLLSLPMSTTLSPNTLHLMVTICIHTMLSRTTTLTLTTPTTISHPNQRPIQRHAMTRATSLLEDACLPTHPKNGITSSVQTC